MNILFISKLSGNMGAGPNNSVPAQVHAQSELDNVLWYNISDVVRDEWNYERVKFVNLSQYPSKRLSDLPIPFNYPDLVIFEECYRFTFERIVGEVRRKRIPYIIVPRSSLTAQAQKHKLLKKMIGNVLFINGFIKNAAAIQYLTKKEQEESQTRWRNNSFVIPNGIYHCKHTMNKTERSSLKGVYIGRISVNQKRLDLLIDAIIELQKELRSEQFTLEIHGTDYEDSKAILNEKIQKEGIADIVYIGDAVFGKNKEKILQDADVFIMTSEFEGLPMGMIEALAYGIPCIATEGTNLADRIEEYDAGWNAGTTVDDVKKALRQMITDRGKLKSKGEHALCLSREYEWDRIAKESHYVYEKIVNMNT